MSEENPYSQLPESAFWSPAIAQKNPLQIKGLWQPKFQIGKTHKIATTGSCFAQHISKALKQRGYDWYDSEPAPSELCETHHKNLNYGIFSFRTGNVYTTALLKQWVSWSIGQVSPDSLEVWQDKNGQYIDPFRPNIMPGGFACAADLYDAREITFSAIREAIEKIDFFIFTMGLTEAWYNDETRLVYPMCPGTIGGEFDPKIHRFINYQYSDIRTSLRETIDLLRTVNPAIKILLTVSPVPLTATASGEHVLTATIHSKSVLRAVAGDMANSRVDTDYFPSYEIISSFPFKGMFYQPNLRSVAPEGVDFVMKAFFEAQSKKEAEEAPSQFDAALKSDELGNEVCEEALLDGFRDVAARQDKPQAAFSVCMIGSSHLGVVRQAWSDYDGVMEKDISCTFFGAPVAGLQKVSVSNGLVHTEDAEVKRSFSITSGGSADIHLADYDCIVLHGNGFPLKGLAKLLDANVMAISGGKDAFPAEVCSSFFDKFLETNPIINLALAIREETDIPIYVSVAPMWSGLEKKNNLAIYGYMETHGAYIKNIYKNKAIALLSDKNIRLIEQPEETMESELFTKAHFTMGYSTGNIKDLGHMNKDYGGLALQAIMSVVSPGM